MLRKLIGIVLVASTAISSLFTLQRCANPTPPSGGPRDTIGPHMVIEKSSPSFQTNFKPDEVVITFDEWVKLKDPSKILISPPLEPAPKISLKKKSLIINFSNTEVREDATYVVNIGNAVVDLTEGNPPENLQFVFATGAKLDSATVSGKVVDAYTKEAVPNVLFTLYSNLADTAVQTENPFYFAKTDENGLFKINNIKPGTYRGMALDNGQQSSYKFDNRLTQQLGFPDSFIVVPATSLVIPDIRISKRETPLKLLAKEDKDQGLIRLIFNKPADQLDYRSSNAYFRINDQDTLKLYSQEAFNDTLFVGLVNGQVSDTIILGKQPLLDTKSYPQLQLVKTPNKTLNPFKSPTFTTNNPIERINTDKIMLTRDTLSDQIAVSTMIDSQQVNTFYVAAPLKDQANYSLSLLPGALEDIFGTFNTDTITSVFTVAPSENFGSLKLKVLGLKPSVDYILHLKVPQQDAIVKTLFFSGKTMYTNELKGLKAATYQIELIEDLNNNHSFDGANYSTQEQPEPVYIFNLEPLRADWEVEAEMNLNDLDME